MAVQMDAPAKNKRRYQADDTIIWSGTDEEIRLAHEKKVKSSRKPSMWQYDPKGGVPTELANLDPSTFSTSPLGQVLCSLPKDILVRICSMLSVHDFIHLSSTCRLLHWRMFTFCTCYTPYTVKKWIRHNPISADSLETTEHLSINQPFALRKPFFFDTVELTLTLPSFCNKFFDKVLPHILAVRGLARNLLLSLLDKPATNFRDTNEFLSAISTSFYNNTYHNPLQQFDIVCKADIYLNCPYARQMNGVFVFPNDYLDRLQVSVFQNKIGTYYSPLDSAVKTTLKNFLAGSTNLVFHRYLNVEEINGRIPLIEYLFEEFGEFDEYFHALGDGDYYSYYYVWKKVIDTENGGKIRIVMENMHRINDATVTIGKEEKFDEMAETYSLSHLHGEKSIWWKMETALEPNETEELDEDGEEQRTSD